MMTKTAINAVKKISNGSTGSANIREGIMEQNGCYVVTDGTMLVRLTEDIPEFPRIKESVVFNAEYFVDDAKKDEEVEFNVSSEKKQWKAFKEAMKLCNVEKSKQAWNLVDDVWVSMKRLETVATAIKATKFYVPANPLAPIYFEGEYGDAILMPVRCLEKNKELIRNAIKAYNNREF
jgi:hypothetical protein